MGLSGQIELSIVGVTIKLNKLNVRPRPNSDLRMTFQNKINCFCQQSWPIPANSGTT